MTNPFVDDPFIAGMKREQAMRNCRKMIAMTDEMSRRVGLDKEIGRELLSIEDTFSYNENRRLDMAAVARSIKAASERLKNRESYSNHQG